MNNFPAMTEERRQELAEVARNEIKVWDDGGHYKELLKIALAALAAPPAPVLRVPDELKVKNGSHQSHIDYAEGWADCIDEVKRLNAQPSPPEASNEQ